MLTAANNELRDARWAGTPMGNLMREYWLPRCLSLGAARADGDPVRLMLLGENLIAFRTTSGAVGVIQNACPHRGASMFFGRNEEEGLRCVYHGWKFDVAGNCVDMPSSPPSRTSRTRSGPVAYEARERGGVIWVYMGPKRAPTSPACPTSRPTCRRPAPTP